MKTAITLFIVLLACNIVQAQILPKDQNFSPILQPLEPIVRDTSILVNSSADCFQGTVTNKVN